MTVHYRLPQTATLRLTERFDTAKTHIDRLP